ncbi:MULTISPECIES: hypothetical protein [Paenibacillus]|uniref:hypothetical protein n=1 Tax=Paenibacillus sp. ALJ109b TaxID=2709068 RepID=UPI0013D41876|nr:hypothetical protein [Paenibacillus sp. ALJ109b]NEU59461.1 hypothetical protein [Paenibacillus sp. ALJ109b]
MKDKFLQEERQEYTDVSTVESQRNDITLEEFPEGPYGSSLMSESLGKSSPWRVDQRTAHRFDYENHELHEGEVRDYPGQDVYDETVPDNVTKPQYPEEEL